MKIILPFEVIDIILEFYYDSAGFSLTERMEKIKNKNPISMFRIKVELWKWKSMNTSIQWLKKGINRPYGVYLSIKEEAYTIEEYCKENHINWKTKLF